MLPWRPGLLITGESQRRASAGLLVENEKDKREDKTDLRTPVHLLVYIMLIPFTIRPRQKLRASDVLEAEIVSETPEIVSSI